MVSAPQYWHPRFKSQRTRFTLSKTTDAPDWWASVWFLIGDLLNSLSASQRTRAGLYLGTVYLQSYLHSFLGATCLRIEQSWLKLAIIPSCLNKVLNPFESV
jgi:hypothetical protein